MSRAPVFFDTWAWVAFFNKSEGDDHERVSELWASLRGDTTPILTSWTVIAETIGFACSGRGIREWSHDGGFQVTRLLHGFVDREYFAAVLTASDAQHRTALALRLQHGGIQKVSLVDCLTAVLLRDLREREKQQCDLVSRDSHFLSLLPGVRMIP